MGPVASMISSAMLMQVQTFKRGKRTEAGVEGDPLGEGRNEQGMEALSSEDRGKALKTRATFWCYTFCSLGCLWTLTWGYGSFCPPAPKQAEELLTEGLRQRLL